MSQTPQPTETIKGVEFPTWTDVTPAGPNIQRATFPSTEFRFAPIAGIQVVGISGKAETGKDYLVEQVLRPLGFFQVSLADHLKTFAVGKGLVTYEEAFHTKPPHVRHILQQEGTERARNVYGEHVWCETMAAWIRLLHERNRVTRFVLADVRFPNEVAFVQRLGGKVIRLNAPERAANSKLSAEARLHSSETALDGFVGFDAVLNNDPEFASTFALAARGYLDHFFHGMPGWECVTPRCAPDQEAA